MKLRTVAKANVIYARDMAIILAELRAKLNSAQFPAGLTTGSILSAFSSGLYSHTFRFL